jgi:hypothetical protein
LLKSEKEKENPREIQTHQFIMIIIILRHSTSNKVHCKIETSKIFFLPFSFACTKSISVFMGSAAMKGTCWCEMREKSTISFCILRFIAKTMKEMKLSLK